MNRGDTVCLMLNYKINGQDLVRDAYDEIELQINNESSSKAIKKLLSNGGIKWSTIDYSGGTFTGYVVNLTQEETFKLATGQSTVQLRIKLNGQVGSSENSTFDLGAVLSTKVL